MKKHLEQTNKLQEFFNDMTTPKASGLSYFLATTFPSVLALALIIFMGLFGLLGEGYETQDYYLYVMYLTPQISFAILAFAYAKMTKQQPLQLVKKQACPWKYFIIALILQFGLFGLSQLNGWFIEWLGGFGYEDTGVPIPSVEGFGLIGVLLVIAVLPAIFEETMFRGILLNGLKSFGQAGAVLLCGALFSLYHQNPEQTVYQFCCGAAYALLALRADSILPTALAHFINNAVIILLHKWPVVLSPTATTIIVIASAVCLLGTLAYLIFIDKQPKLSIQNPKKERTDFALGAAMGVLICLLSWFTSLFQGM